MNLPRKLGIAIVMIVPAFVFGGLVWEFIKSWWIVLVLEIAMIVVYFLIIKGKFSTKTQEA